MSYEEPDFDLLCLSHLRWDFVFQRPQQLLTRCARSRRVFYVEEPELHSGMNALDERVRENGVRVLVPQLSDDLRGAATGRVTESLLSGYFAERSLKQPVLWYYTPQALEFSASWSASVIVYDCMDELSAFAFAPSELKTREAELMKRADLVFTGGHSLYAAKSKQHPRVFAFPSSVDVPHFNQARQPGLSDPTDQAFLSHPRAGWFGVIDERMDLELLRKTAELCPDWQFVMIGPVVKIDPDTLPRSSNIHYLGSKPYANLPDYLAHWDVAIMPFAKNNSTEYISPTKTPEYLAGGCPVVSTSIRDVVVPYADLGLARIADQAETFAAALRQCVSEGREGLLRRADAYLAELSWDKTWSEMESLVESVLAASLV
jgi:UDP-galactopyranose mutase